MRLTLEKANTDEWYTPDWAVEPLVKYIPRGAKVWCPFDVCTSAFVRVFRSRGIDVVNTHIENGNDFFTMSVPNGATHIISNPPYSRRDDVLSRLLDLGLPYAMLLSSLGIGEGKRWQLFSRGGCQFLIPSRRVNYFNDEIVNKSAAFHSWYVCRNFLPRDIVFEEFVK